MAAPTPFYDAHFHVWDASKASFEDVALLFPPGGREVYDVDAYQSDVELCSEAGIRHCGGVFVEAMSVQFKDLPFPEMAEKCLHEAKWARATLQTSEKPYAMVASALLEDPNVEDLLRKYVEMNASGEKVKIRGIRQILNYEPSWPRTTEDLLLNKQWRKGYALLEKHGLSFDLQANPHQLPAAAELAAEFPGIKMVVNHIGTPTLDDLTAADKAEAYWKAMASLAKLPNVYMKISMLCYTSKTFDEEKPCTDAVRRIVDLFGVRRCMVASNFPVEPNEGWPAPKLFAAYKAMLSTVCDEEGRLFGGTCREVYGV